MSAVTRVRAPSRIPSAAGEVKRGLLSSDQLFLPSFCDIRLVFAVVLIGELLALILVLSSGPVSDPWHRLGLVSLFVQWIVLTSSAVLCALRPLLSRFSNAAAALISYLLLLLVTALVSEAAYRLLDQGWVYVAPLTRTEFLLRNLGVSAILSALVLRYLFLQHHWRQQVEAEALARVQALRARIRPHFLFNSLNTIAALTASEPEVAEEAVQDLADLFRATLGDARERVPLAQELALARQYVQLESLRLGDRLDVDWELNDLPGELLVPFLILQPLVENAIYHGIEPLPEGGVIRVWGRRGRGQVVIRVSNPVSDRTAPNRREGNRIAQDNIRQRLELAYGKEGSLITELRDGRYEVEVRFPWEGAACAV